MLRSAATTVLRSVWGWVTLQVERELSNGSKVFWDAVRNALYAPFLVSTVLLLAHRIDEHNWSLVALATVGADGVKKSATAIGASISGAAGSVASSALGALKKRTSEHTPPEDHHE